MVVSTADPNDHTVALGEKGVMVLLVIIGSVPYKLIVWR